MGGRVIQGFFIGGAMRPQPAPPAEARPRHPTGASPPAFAGRSAPLQARMAPGRPPLAHQRAGPVAQRHGGDGSFEIDPVQLGLARGGGKPLPQAVLAKMEAAFGADFSAVRVHVGPQASRIGAVAFTTGNDLYFAPGRFQPDSVQGQQLIGHELAHVIQQRQGRVRAPGGGVAVVQDASLEAEADRLGMRAAMQAAAVQPKMATAAGRERSVGVVQAARSSGGLLGNGRVSSQERRQRVFAVMWNGVGDLARRLDRRAAQRELPTISEVREFRGLMRWARTDDVPSAAARLARHEAAINAAAEEHVFERAQAARRDDIAALGRRQLVRGATGPRDRRPRPPLPPVRVRVGVIFRIDGRGTAHSGHDMEGIRAINGLGGTGLPMRFQVEPVALPPGASGSAVPVRLADTAQNLSMFRSHLRGIDILYIPGAPAAITAQVGDSEGDASFNVPKGMGKTEADSRGPYELGLIMAARTMGIPILAICAGSWRLLQAYGGEVRTLPEAQRDLHKSPGKSAQEVWGLEHGIRVQPGTLLHDLLGTVDLPHSNSTHWAVAAEADDVLTPHRGAGRYPLAHHRAVRDETPNAMLRITARAYGPTHEPSVEAFETRHGAPHIGIQWHPETYLPGMPGHDAASSTHHGASARLFRRIAEAGATRRNRAAVNTELLVRQIQRALGASSVETAHEVYLEIQEGLENPPTREDIDDYLRMFNLAL